MNKVILILTMVLGVTGCTTSSSLFGGSDIQITATEAGMRAYGDHLNAIITNGKASADSLDTPAYQMRREQDNNRVLRKLGWSPTVIKKGE